MPSSKRNRRRTNLFLAGLSFLLICTACTSAASASSEISSVQSSIVSSSSLSSAASSSSEAVSSSEPESSSMQPEDIFGEEPIVPVETEHITFYFPEELTADMTLEHLEEDGHQLIAFTGTFGGKELRLFSVVFGPPGTEQGDFQIGVLQDDAAGEVPVSIRVNVQQQEDWSAEDFERINILQERVNDIIVQFHSDPRFSPNS